MTVPTEAQAMADLEYLFNHCSDWASKTHDEIKTEGVYIFGSTIQREGDQFDRKNSDIDLIVIIPSIAKFAHERVDWLESLLRAKHDLELSLIPILERADAAKPIVSVVAITQQELRADIHKSRTRKFFRVNQFRSLLNLKQASIKLLNIDPVEISDSARQVVEFTQDFRNKFLGATAARPEPLKAWDDDTDPIPKDIMRYAAIAWSISKEVPIFDVQFGLDELSNHIYQIREKDRSYLALSEWVSVRRGSRGQRSNLSPRNHLLLAETLYDVCSLGDLIEYSNPIPDQRARTQSQSNELALIPVTFEVRADGRLAGNRDDIQAMLAEAAVNAKWRRPILSVAMQEVIAIDAKLSSIAGSNLAKDRIQRADLIERRTEIESVKPLIELGLSNLIEYQKCLLPESIFPKRHGVFLAKTIHTYITRCFGWRSRGGMLEAWKKWDDKSFSFSFSIPSQKLANFLTDRYDLQDVLMLADENKEIGEFPADIIADFFVPELVLHFVVNELKSNFRFESNDQKQHLLTAGDWQIGVK